MASDGLKRVVITGANKGIGLALAERVLTSHADTIVYLGARDEARGIAARDHLVTLYPAVASRVVVLPLDVSIPASVASAAASLAGVRLYGLVNNAGTWGSVSDTFATNVFGVKNVTDAFLPLLRASGGEARIVMVSSGVAPQYLMKCTPDRVKAFTSKTASVAEVVAAAAECQAGQEAASGENGDRSAALVAAGYPPLDAQSAYFASKAFLNSYTLALAAELGPASAITVNACSPGFVATDMTAAFFKQMGKSPEEAGAISPSAGTAAPYMLLLGAPGGTGLFFGSDCLRSPLDKYRAPGSPAYGDGQTE